MKPTIELLTIQDIMQMFSVTKQTVYRWVRTGKFPPPITVGRSSRWRVKDVDAFLSRKAKTAQTGSL